MRAQPHICNQFRPTHMFAFLRMCSYGSLEVDESIESLVSSAARLHANATRAIATAALRRSLGQRAHGTTPPQVRVAKEHQVATARSDGREAANDARGLARLLLLALAALETSGLSEERGGCGEGGARHQ